MKGLRRSLFVLLLAAIVFTIFAGLSMAQPWDSESYENGRDWAVLAALVAFGVSPYVVMLFLPRWFRQNPNALLTFIIGAAVITGLGVFAISYTIFGPPDAQGGLIFLSLPLFQWFAAGVLTALCLAVGRFTRSRA